MAEWVQAGGNIWNVMKRKRESESERERERGRDRMVDVNLTIPCH